jgi:hypothetical protein
MFARLTVFEMHPGADTPTDGDPVTIDTENLRDDLERPVLQILLEPIDEAVDA